MVGQTLSVSGSGGVCVATPFAVTAADADCIGQAAAQGQLEVAAVAGQVRRSWGAVCAATDLTACGAAWRAGARGR